MPSTWTRTAIAAASAMLLSTAAFGLAATGNPEQPPSETGGQSRPVETEGKQSRAYELRQQGTAPNKCRSGASTEAEAVRDCTTVLNCPSGTTVKCSYRSNNQDWICSCK